MLQGIDDRGQVIPVASPNAYVLNYIICWGVCRWESNTAAPGKLSYGKNIWLCEISSRMLILWQGTTGCVVSRSREHSPLAAGAESRRQRTRGWEIRDHVTNTFISCVSTTMWPHIYCFPLWLLSRLHSTIYLYNRIVLWLSSVHSIQTTETHRCYFLHSDYPIHTIRRSLSR